MQRTLPRVTRAPDARARTRRGIHLGLRWLLGLTLLTSSAGKLLDIPGFHDVMAEYLLFPGWSLWFIAVFMPLLEAGIAFTLITGRRLREGIVSSLLLHSSFAAILGLELLRGIDLKNCGCFGVFWARPLSWISPLEDVVMLAITVGIVATLPVLRERSTSDPAETHAE